MCWWKSENAGCCDLQDGGLHVHILNVIGRSWKAVLPFSHLPQQPLLCSCLFPSCLHIFLPPSLLCFYGSCLCTHISLCKITDNHISCCLASVPSWNVRQGSLIYSHMPPPPALFLSLFLLFSVLVPPLHTVSLPTWNRNVSSFSLRSWGGLSEENQKKKYCLRENKSHCRAEWFSENCKASVTGVLFFHAFRIEWRSFLQSCADSYWSEMMQPFYFKVQCCFSSITRW